jgi:hypothetical protein
MIEIRKYRVIIYEKVQIMSENKIKPLKIFHALQRSTHEAKAEK